MPLAGGWVVPHAPVLLPEVSRLAAAARRPGPLDLPATDAVVVASPHGGRTGVYAGTAGSLAGFGLPSVIRGAPSAPGRAKRLAESWGVPLLDAPLDHGCLVPLWWVDGAAPLLACAFAEITGPSPAASPGDVASAARGLASALERLARRARVTFVASAHLSGGLTPGAPLAALPGASDFDRHVLTTLERDPAELLELPPDEWARADACGLGPLTTLAVLFAGGTAEVIHYEHPFGVGYVHARVAP